MQSLSSSSNPYFQSGAGGVGDDARSPLLAQEAAAQEGGGAKAVKLVYVLTI